MKKAKIFLLSLLIVCFAASGTVFAKASINNIINKVTSDSTSIHLLLEKVVPSVVNIVSVGEIPGPKSHFLKKRLLRKYGYRRLKEKNRFISLGSGVIIDSSKGLIVTNAHIIDLSKSITVTLNDGRRYQAEKIGVDNKTDIAVIQIQAENLKALSFSDSSVLKVGDFVTAIGSPFGLDQTVTSGIISALHRNVGLEDFENFIQTDAPINAGSSGGALVNMKGELVGINTAILTPSGGSVGIGFAIPANMVKSVITQILKFGKVQRGLTGILVQTLSPDIANASNVSGTKGAIIAKVFPYSPAENAGLQTGDIITHINGKQVKTNDDVLNSVGLLRIGSTAKLTILRNGKQLTKEVQTEDHKVSEEKNKKANPYLYGIKMQNLEEMLADNSYVKGVRVLSVKEYSAAWIAGLRRGDIITFVNNQPITSVKQAKMLAKPNKNGLLLNVLRQSSALFMVIK